MNATSYLNALVRVLLSALFGAIASHLTPWVWSLVNNYIILVGGQEAVITWISGLVVVVIFSMLARLKSRYHIGIALRLPEGSSIADVQANSKALELATPTRVEPAVVGPDPDLGIRRPPDKGITELGVLLLIVVLLLLFGAGGLWGGPGYGGGFLLLVIIVVLLATGRI